MSAVLAALPPGVRVLIDTSVLIAHLGGSEATATVATDVVEQCLRSGRNEGVISAITVGELLVRPNRAGRQAVDAILGLLWSLPDVHIRSVDFLVAAEAARMRAAVGLSVPDSLILATGMLTSATHLITNDRALMERSAAAAPGLRTLLISDLAS